MFKKLIILVVLLLVNVPAFAQSVENAWAKIYKGQEDLANGWVFIDSTGPARSGMGCAYDVNRDRLVVFGGGDETFATLYGDTWEWDRVQWVQVDTSGPFRRGNCAMVYDEARANVLLFGGWTRPDNYLGDTWVWDGSNWTEKVVSGPSARANCAIAYDRNRQRVVLFGGSYYQTIIGETWEWDGNNWELRSTSGPSARMFARMVFDEKRQRSILFGGQTHYSGEVLNDTWEWDGTNWVQVDSGGPPGRVFHTMAYDPIKDQTVLFGGKDGFYPTRHFDDTWEWNGSEWTQMAVKGPGARSNAQMVFHDSLGQAILIGGTNDTAMYKDMWSYIGLLPDYEFHDLNDNQIPAGWTQELIRGGPGIENGRLWARVTDGGASLKRLGTLPSGATGIRMEYDGNISYSDFGLHNEVEIRVATDTFFLWNGMAAYNFGLVHKVRIRRNSSPFIIDADFPLEYADFHYTVIFTEGKIQYKCVRISDGGVKFDTTVYDTNMHIGQSQEIKFMVYTTTINDTWMDNLLVTAFYTLAFDTLFFFAYSPVDLIVTDPVGDSIGIDFNTIPDATYDTTNDQDKVTIPGPLLGEYTVEVKREPDADTGHYSLAIKLDGNEDKPLAQNFPIPPPDQVDSYTYPVIEYLRGDANMDKKTSVSDVIFLINYLFKGGPAPIPEYLGDVNCDGKVTVSDVVYLINYLFKGGPAPCS